ncbi:MFS transporter [Parasphaerochaeta coccoides]|uniref:Major facilitator superfamily MFS_1 n=1 Tax=Parasphaerochaeta coccoides (strain ATCC BAA-1237 / DSM 17374 / SPN1) TaxID=760011 RepID=F4GHF6_PARC1|nr:MFS transporter [Parasphaerochaeta coccoides]AEC02545.1 major facilitator superfamily MFS_1 [Parasphaerochaeta coccoides DSM 17374]
MQQEHKEKKGLKGYYKTTFLIGLGFFTMGLMDPLYDTFVPQFLGRYIESNGVIGTVMTLDNVLAIFLIPIFAALSDRTRTRIGRRMPYIVTLLPLAAIAFGIIPVTALTSLSILILTIFLLNIFKQAVRGPVVALMPDMVPGDLRSEANGVINTMGGVATIVGTLGLSLLMNVPVSLPGFSEPQKNILSFPVATILIILAVVLLFVFVKEKKAEPTTGDTKEKEKTPILRSIGFVFKEKDKSALFILLSLLTWFIGYQGVLPFLGKYSSEVLGATGGLSAFGAGMVGIAYAIFAIPSGVMAHRYGRKKTIRLALVALVAVLLLLFVHSFVTGGLAAMPRLASFWVLLFCFGIFWVTIVTNSFPMLWQMASFETIGIYTGLYYFFSQLASIIAPPITGFLIDISSYSVLFIFAAVCMALACFFMSKVKRGEPDDKPVEQPS